ncbi:MAG: phage virion morphogenesis protein [Desulfovibrio sp.]|jgi:phage virion morphogenesis protein|nr:phage virion morphogenesis protein [Desulfovibrio sp.]
MAQNGVSLKWNGFDKAVAKAAKKMANSRLLMASVGEALVSGTIRRFNNEESPKGEKWEKSGRAIAEGGQTLSDTAHLRKSIDFKATPAQVMVGSNLLYARIHQLGGTIKPKKGKALKFKGKNGQDIFVSEVNMPARPYLGVSKADMDEVRETMAEFIKGAFKG